MKKKLATFIISFGLLLSFSAIGAGCDAGFEDVSGVCVPMNTGLADTPVDVILDSFMMWILSIFSILGIIAFVISGIQYLTSAGDEGQVETAKRNMKWSIVGILVGLSGIIVMQAVFRLLGGSDYF